MLNTALSSGEKVPEVRGRVRGHFHASGCRDARWRVVLLLIDTWHRVIRSFITHLSVGWILQLNCAPFFTLTFGLKAIVSPASRMKLLAGGTSTPPCTSILV